MDFCELHNLKYFVAFGTLLGVVRHSGSAFQIFHSRFLIGAYIGYVKLMNTINDNSDIQYRVLQESDYNITMPDQGRTLFGGIHHVDNIENFEIKNAKAVLTNEKLTLYSDDERHRFFTNNEVDNDTRLLIIGDSYFNTFIIDDLAESFHETIIIWGDYLLEVQNIIDTYDADIVIVEAAERVDRTPRIINSVTAMKTSITVIN